jgi:hypothetical protein
VIGLKSSVDRLFHNYLLRKSLLSPLPTLIHKRNSASQHLQFKIFCLEVSNPWLTSVVCPIINDEMTRQNCLQYSQSASSQWSGRCRLSCSSNLGMDSAVSCAAEADETVMLQQ